MKEILLRFCLVLTIIAAICSCGEKSEQHKWLGAWKVVKVWYPVGVEFKESDTGEPSVLHIFANDSVKYICNAQFLKDAITITSDEKLNYSCIYKGNGEYLYFEGKDRYPLKFLNDTTLMIQRMGVRYTMVKVGGIIQNNEKQIAEFLGSCNYDKENSKSSFLISNTEKQLRKTNYTLLYVLAAVLIVALIITIYCVRIHRRSKLLKERLQAMTEEREQRPEKISKALKDVEDDFFMSDYYTSIHTRIANGENLSDADWSEMKKQLNRVYPSFTLRLSELISMSEVEMKVCLLIKLRATPKEMSHVLNRDHSSISTIRSRLYKKVFNTKGKSSDWDNFVISL